MGSDEASATPNAVDTTPSMPLAPRLATTRGGCGRGTPNASRSRTGIDDDTTSVEPAGIRAKSRWANEGSVSGAPSPADAPSGPQAADHRPGLAFGGLPVPAPGAEGRSPPSRSPSHRRTRAASSQNSVGSDRMNVDASRCGSRHRPHGSITTTSAPPADRRRHEAVDHLGRPRLAQPQHRLRPVPAGEPLRAEDAVGRRRSHRVGGDGAPSAVRPGPATPASPTTRAPRPDRRTRPRPR